MLEMIANCGWNSVLCLFYLDYGLYVMHLSFKWSWFSVFFGLMTFFPLVFKLYNQNPRIPILLNWVYWDYVGLFFCSLRTNSSTNIFGSVARKRSWKYIFPGILIISLVLRGELKPTNLKDYFSPVFYSGY